MESLGVGAFPDGAWDCFHRIFAIDEGQDYLPQFFNEDGNTRMQHSMFSCTPESGLNESMFNSFAALNSDLQYLSQESSSSNNGNIGGYTNSFFSNTDQVLLNETLCTSIDFCMMSEKDYHPASIVPLLSGIAIEENVSFNNDGRSDRLEKNSDRCEVEPILKRRKFDDMSAALEVLEQDKKITNSSESQKKRPRVSKDVPRSMQNARSKIRNQKHADIISENKVEETNVGSNEQGSNSEGATTISSSSSSKSPASLNSNGKTRASRGSATDPQSLYARKRRERINERLRILQNLVPNGTKVDISTMLEDALHYVKFLQLQIKLLSSDDLWMYSPIAYNGLDIGLNLTPED